MKERKLIFELFRIAKGAVSECCNKSNNRNNCLNETDKDKCKCD